MRRDDLVVGLSLANLCLLRAWKEVLALAGPTGYYLSPATSLPWALLLDVLVLGTLFAAGAHLARRSGDARLLHVARALFLLALLIPLDALRTEFRVPRLFEFATWVLEPAGRPIPLRDLAPLIPIAVFARWPARSARYARATLLFFAPFVLVTFGRATWLGIRHPIGTAYAERPSAPALPAAAPGAPRVLVLVFDELDQRLAFGERPAGLELPALDGLRSEGLYASSATPPSWETLLSFPALLAGRMVVAARAVGPSALLLRFEGEADAVHDWRGEQSVFTRARALGVNGGLVGWYHPYCRVLDALTRCAWEPYFDVINRGGGAGLGGAMIEQLRSLSPWDRQRRHILGYRRILDEALTAATDSTLGVVFVHWPVPHHPFIYDPARDRLTVHRYGATGYVDQLRLVDKTVAELRAALERVGLWAATTVIVTSDHAARVKDRPEEGSRRDERVPFVVKLPGSAGGSSYDRSFSTVMLSDFVLAVLRREVTAPAQAARWLDRNAPPRPVQARR
ncbi:MAG TPA: sulfatase-like hydrolase/transferase [Gemmatimonadales bacterium]